MIGEQKTGTLQGIVLSMASHEDISVEVGGAPGKLAVLDGDGAVVASGDQVAREVRGVVVNSYRNFLQGQGYLRARAQFTPA